MASENPYVITLGTAGGPRVWTSPNIEPRCGIATAIVLPDRWYLIDCGLGVYQQIRKAGLGFHNLAGIFITHLHSDHVIDLNNIMCLAFSDLHGLEKPIPIYGPGDRGALPAVSPRAKQLVNPVFPDDPTPGTVGMVEHSLRALATDLNDRVLDSLRPDPTGIWHGHDIQLPTDIGYDPNQSPSPSMRPFTIFEDDAVQVTATLVVHPPIAPAFGFRFNFASGHSVTISGDTAFSENLIELAEGTDLLLHEAIDFDWANVFNDVNTKTGRAVIDHHKKSHSSSKDAGVVAKQSGAKSLALHHLVPGYAEEKTWGPAKESFGKEVLIPNDNDVIPL